MIKKFKNIVRTEFRVEKLVERKGDKLNVKWKGYAISFNSWIDKRDIVKITEYFPKPKGLGGNV